MSEKLIEKLSGFFGPDNVSVKDVDKLIYSHDASTEVGTVKAIVFPTDAKQIQMFVRYALRTKLNIVPRGGGTGLAGGAIPNDSIVLDMSKMNKIESVDASSKKVILEPGVILQDLNDKLDDYDLVFPIQPASNSVCQVGGMVSTNAAGINAIRFGNTREWVERIEMVDGTGKLVSIDPKDYCGTEGILGVVTKLTLRLKDQDDNKTLTVKTFNDLDKMVDFVKDHVGNQHVIAIEFFGKYSAELADLKKRYHVFVEFDNDEGEVSDSERIEEILQLRKGLGPILSSKGYTIMEDPQIPIAKLSRFVRWLYNNKIPVFGHIGIGLLHPRFKPNQQSLIKKMFKEVENLDGIVSGEHGIGIAKKQFVSAGYVKKLKKLKEKHDPENIFNMGKIYD